MTRSCLGDLSMRRYIILRAVNQATWLVGKKLLTSRKLYCEIETAI